jgi:hypothetical protein
MYQIRPSYLDEAQTQLSVGGCGCCAKHKFFPVAVDDLDDYEQIQTEDIEKARLLSTAA